MPNNRFSTSVAGRAVTILSQGNQIVRGIQQTKTLNFRPTNSVPANSVGGPSPNAVNNGSPNRGGNGRTQPN